MTKKTKATVFLKTGSQQVALRTLILRLPRRRKRPDPLKIFRARFKRNEPGYRFLAEHGD